MLGQQNWQGEAIGASDLLKNPVAQMRLAQEMRIMVKGDLIKTLPIASPSLTA